MLPKSLNAHAGDRSCWETRTDVKIYGFYHIATVGLWKEVVDDQLLTLAKSGLYDVAERIFVTVVGPEIEKVTLPKKFEIVYQSPDPVGCYERKILQFMHGFCSKEPGNHKIWYMHSKGVRHSADPVMFCRVSDWRRFMEHFVIKQYKHCLSVLEDHDTCGCNLIGFYAGNFWWARSHYIKTLSPEIGEDYVAPELWICTNPEGRHHCLFQSNVHHYDQRYEESNYTSRSPSSINHQIQLIDFGGPITGGEEEDSTETPQNPADGKDANDLASSDVAKKDDIRALYAGWDIGGASTTSAHKRRLNNDTKRTSTPFVLKHNVGGTKRKIGRDMCASSTNGD